VLLLRPRHGLIEPVPVDVDAYFSRAEIDRARDFRRGQLVLAGTSALVKGAVLAALVARRRRRARGSRRPLVSGALTGAGLSVTLELASLPLAVLGRRRSLKVGLATDTWGHWASDLGKSSGIGTALAGGGAALASGLIGRFGSRWWLPASALSVGLGAGFLYAGPVLLDPLFNKFTPLAEGQARRDVLELAHRAGVDVGEVYVVDASRRTTAANAYVTGLGRTKRVVLYDTLLEHFDREETRLVVAHELAHVRHRDVLRGLGFVALVAPAGAFAGAQLAAQLARGAEASAIVPALALSFALVSAPVGLLANQLSRRVEARADAFSLRLTEAPEPFISFERRITVRNVADPDPPRWLRILSTHPSTVERIGIAEAYRLARG
jgi:STE24 endopeptidase